MPLNNKVPRRFIPANLSSNFARFHKGQLLLLALTLALVGAGSAVMAIAMSN